MSRILMLVTNDLRFDARVEKEASSLASVGYEVTILAVHGEGLPAADERDGFAIRRVAEPLASGGGPLARKFRRLREFRSIGQAFAAAARDLKVDAVHAHDLDTLRAGVAIAREHGARLVYDSHELYAEAVYPGQASGAVHRWLMGLQRRYWTFVERRYISIADVVITVNEQCGRELVRRYGIREPVIVMNKPEGSAGDDSLPLPDLPGTVFLYQGALIHDRGIEEFLEAVARVPSASAVVMGSGVLEKPLRLRCQRSDLAARSVVMPGVPWRDVVRYARSADVGVLPLKATQMSYRLSSPNKLLEYVQAGLPVCASAIPFAAEFIEQHGCGVLVPPGDVDALAEAIRSLATDSELRSRLAAASRAAAPFVTWDPEAAKLAEVYARLFA